MLFNSFEFLIFSIITIPTYFLLKHKFRWLWLLIASCVFYMYFIPGYVLILFAVIIIDYFAALQIAKAKSNNKKKWLLLSLAGNLGILFFFKYYDFFIDNINAINTYLPFVKNRLSHLNIILPIGLSFHTFQAISYTVEVYKGNQQPEKHFGIYALYVMFFPQLVAGPIERPQNMLHQFYEEKKFDFQVFTSGLKLVLLGLFMKSVIADRVAIPVDTIFNNYKEQWGGFAIIISAILFAIQIYCDFAGYSYMAVGLAKLLGFKLMINFKQPYLSKNIAEFWSKWHISLSTWFRDYVYIPLGGNRVSKKRLCFNLTLVFLLSGLWHGANYTFLCWGLMHAVLIILFVFIVSKFKLKISSVLSIVVTFLLVSLSWIFFRADSFITAQKMFATILNIDNSYFKLYTNNDIHGLKGTYLGLPLWKFVYTVMLVVLSFVIDYLIAKNEFKKLYHKPKWLQWGFYYVVIIAILFLGVFDTKQFIYFQF